LREAVLGVTTFEITKGPPALVEHGFIRHVAWRGYLTSGLLTLTSAPDDR
jgi:hypothetical protein